MIENDEHDDVNIWLAYSDLFSGVLVVAISILMFQLFPQTGNGNGEDDELKKRREAQWGMTQKLFEEIHSKGYLPEPSSLSQVKERFGDKTNTYPNLVKFIDSKGNEAAVIFKPEGEEQRITFGSQVLFDNEGIFRNKIKPEGITLLQSVGTSILTQGGLDSEIRVIGHTDVKPPRIGESLDYNWILSSERAIAVVTELLTDPEISKGLPAHIREEYDRYQRGKITLNFPPNRISAIGRGEFEPVGSTISEQWKERQKRIYNSWNDEEAMKQNRRIEIVLRSLPLGTIPFNEQPLRK